MSMDANAEIQALATRISNQRAEIERLTADRHAQEEWLKEWRGRVIRAVNENANLTAERGDFSHGVDGCLGLSVKTLDRDCTKSKARKHCQRNCVVRFHGLCSLFIARKFSPEACAHCQQQSIQNCSLRIGGRN